MDKTPKCNYGNCVPTANAVASRSQKHTSTKALAARVSDVTGSTVTRLRVGGDGRVIEADFVSAHALFAKNVLEALKQWTFTPSEQEHVIEVVCRFEFYTDKCSTTETLVSATLPTEVLIRTPSKCI